MAKKKTTKKTTKPTLPIDLWFCPVTQMSHCYHIKMVQNGCINGTNVVESKQTLICCFCGVTELDTHGPYHPEKYGKTTTTISTAGPWVNNPFSGNITAKWKLQTDGTWLLEP